MVSERLSEADRFLLDAVRRGDEAGWAALVQRYQGRLLAFAQRRTGDDAARAEDIVQDTFVDFLRALPRYRGEASLETYLFTILRRRVIDHYRGRRADVALLHELGGAGRDADTPPDPMAGLPGDDPSASWYARRDEMDQLHQEALADALGELVRQCQDRRNFEELKIVELIFFSQQRNRDVAAILGVTENQVALTKHRWLKRLRDRVAAGLRGRHVGAVAADEWEPPDTMLSSLWSHQRLSCPKRSTIGAYLLGTLDEPWRDYVAFHLQTQGCGFCRANLDDLEQQTAEPAADALRDRVLESTVGFFK